MCFCLLSILKLIYVMKPLITINFIFILKIVCPANVRLTYNRRMIVQLFYRMSDKNMIIAHKNFTFTQILVVNLLI